MEYPPSYCDGQLYVNTFKGRTAALDARTGKVIWSRTDSGAEALDTCHRRSAPDRLVEERCRHSPRPVEWADALAAANERQGRVLARRHREHRRTSERPTAGSSPWIRGTGTYGGRTTPAGASTRAHPSSETASASRRMRARCSASTAATARSSGASTSSEISSATTASTRVRQPTASASSLFPGRGRSLPSPRRTGAACGREASVHRLHDAGCGGRPGVRRRLRRCAARLQRPVGPAALAALRARANPRCSRRRRQPRLLLDARDAHVCSSRHRRARSSGRSAWASTRPASPPTQHYYFSLNGILTAFRGQE